MPDMYKYTTREGLLARDSCDLDRVAHYTSAYSRPDSLEMTKSVTFAQFHKETTQTSSRQLVSV